MTRPAFWQNNYVYYEIIFGSWQLFFKNIIAS